MVKKDMTLTKNQRAVLRLKFGGKCAYCGCDLPENGWHADHVDPVHREWWKTTDWLLRHPGSVAGFERPENDRLDNLFPSCRACNIDKHASPLESWRQQMQKRVDVCRRNYSAFRHAERFGLVVEVKIPIVFWFEKYEKKSLTLS
jgi:hypothetical protein